ncbi:MAG: integrin [Deltaproteobacteria bacterium]|nr:integrin [Deltaproteobacteria bacterium]
MRLALLASVLGAVAIAGCSALFPLEQSDADASGDASLRTDAGGDADSGIDAGGGVDSGTDADADSGTDAGSEIDAGVPDGGGEADGSVPDPIEAQEAYIKASNTGVGDEFGFSVALSADGSVLAVGAYGEDSDATGVGGVQGSDAAGNSGAVYLFRRDDDGAWAQEAYVKASNTDAGDSFGWSVALSADGSVLAVGAHTEDSAAGFVDGDQVSNDAADSGAVYVFRRDGGGVWGQEAYVKASNTDAGDGFGLSVALSADGSVLAVGAYGEDSDATGVGGNQASDAAPWAGAAYVFRRGGEAWQQEAYVKASNTDAGDVFGWSVALSADGSVLAVGADQERSAATGVDGDQESDAAESSGAAYLFRRDENGTWAQEAYVKASNTDSSDAFGWSVALSADGSALAVGAPAEDSAATGVGGDQADDEDGNSGAAYVFRRVDGAWAQEAYAKASNTDATDFFGRVALSADGSVLAVGAMYEDSAATGVGGDEGDNAAAGSGAAYVLRREGGLWAQETYVKASNTDPGDELGVCVALSADGSVLAVGARYEDSDATGVNGDEGSDAAADSSAVYVFR